MSYAKHTPKPWVRDGTICAPEKLEIDLRLDNDGDNWITIKGPNAEANAHLIAAAPDLLKAQTMGSQVNTPDFLDWMADRLVNVYKESPNVDFVRSLRMRAVAGRAAIAQAEGLIIS